MQWTGDAFVDGSSVPNRKNTSGRRGTSATEGGVPGAAEGVLVHTELLPQRLLNLEPSHVHWFWKGTWRTTHLDYERNKSCLDGF